MLPRFLLRILITAAVILGCVVSFSGIFRYYAGTTLEFSLLVSSLLIGLPLALLNLPSKSDPGVGHRLSVAPVVLGTLGVFAWLVYLLWVNAFNGYPTVGGGDSGNHVTILKAFAAHDAKIYEGFIVFHTAAFWLQKLGLASFEFSSFRTLFYTVMFVVTASIPAFAFQFVKNDSAPTFLPRLSLFLVGWTTFFIAPVYGYQQADGFLAHIFAMIPLLAIWAVYALGTSNVFRVGLLCLGIAVYRHTYGLNLCDLLLATGVLLALERPFGDWRDRFIVAAGVALIFAAAFAYYKINTVIAVPGAIIPSNLWLGMLANAVGVAWLVRERLNTSAGRGADQRKLRFIDFAAAFIAVSTVAQGIFGVLHPTSNYYIHKYSLHSQTILGIAVCVVFSAKAAPTRWKVWILPICILLALGYTHRKLRRTALERGFGSAPYSRVWSIVDMETYQTIKQTTSAHPNKSVLLIDPWWPRFNFTNAMFGYVSHGKEVPTRGEDRCFFWYESTSQIERLTSFDQGGVIPFSLLALQDSLSQSVGKMCKRLVHKLDNEQVALCSLCDSQEAK